MSLYLRKVIHPQAHDNYRVVLKDYIPEIEIGSIGVQHNGWTWAIDTVIPMREMDAQGTGKDRKDCIRQFREATMASCLAMSSSRAAKSYSRLHGR